MIIFNSIIQCLGVEEKDPRDQPVKNWKNRDDFEDRTVHGYPELKESTKTINWIRPNWKNRGDSEDPIVHGVTPDQRR